MMFRDSQRRLSRDVTWGLALIALLALTGCGGGSGDEGTVDLSPQKSGEVKTGLTKEAEARARRIATEASGKAR
jgi:hypothetical protein